MSKNGSRKRKGGEREGEWGTLGLSCPCRIGLE